MDHLKEQRRRWMRSLYYVSARNMSLIWMRQSARGFVLIWRLFNQSRRLMMLPIVVWVAAAEVVEPSMFSLQKVFMIGISTVVLQLLVVVMLLVAYRQFPLVPWVPSYLLFRLFRWYISLEGFLTMRLKERSPRKALIPGDTEPVF